MWEDVDLERGVLRVRRTLQEGEMLPPKTAKSRRQIRLTRRALDALYRHWRNQETERALANGTSTEQGLVFPNLGGFSGGDPKRASSCLGARYALADLLERGSVGW
jgi:integrase